MHQTCLNSPIIQLFVYKQLRDEETPKDAQETNWFSAPSALSIYGHYLNLDKDHNGMLSKNELGGYGSGTLTNVFLDRLFAECITYDGEMDYKTYLDFVLALENRQEPQSLQYLFRILDFNHQGYLTSFTLNYFFKVSLTKPELIIFHANVAFGYRAFKSRSNHTEPNL